MKKLPISLSTTPETQIIWHRLYESIYLRILKISRLRIQVGITDIGIYVVLFIGKFALTALLPKDFHIFEGKKIIKFQNNDIKDNVNTISSKRPW